MNVVMTGAGRLVEVQATAEGTTFSRAELDVLLDLAEGGVRELTAAQRAATCVTRIVLATGNPHKVAELEPLLAGAEVSGARRRASTPRRPAHPLPERLDQGRRPARPGRSPRRRGGRRLGPRGARPRRAPGRLQLAATPGRTPPTPTTAAACSRSSRAWRTAARPSSACSSGLAPATAAGGLRGLPGHHRAGAARLRRLRLRPGLPARGRAPLDGRDDAARRRRRSPTAAGRHGGWPRCSAPV